MDFDAVALEKCKLKQYFHESPRFIAMLFCEAH